MAEDAQRAAAELRGGVESTTAVRWLVERAQGGDRAALEELLLHFDRIYSCLHMSVGNRHDAEDLTNQTFVKMLKVDQDDSNGRQGHDLRVAVPDRAQPGDGPTSAHQAAARGGGPTSPRIPRSTRLRTTMPINPLAARVRDDRGPVSPDQQQVLAAQVRLQLRTPRWRPSSGRPRVPIKSSSAPCPRHAPAASDEKDRIACPSRSASSRPSQARRRACRPAGVVPDSECYGKPHVGMAPIPDDRLEQVAGIVGSEKVTHAALRIVDVPGSGPPRSAGSRAVTLSSQFSTPLRRGSDPAAGLSDQARRARRRGSRSRRAQARAHSRQQAEVRGGGAQAVVALEAPSRTSIPGEASVRPRGSEVPPRLEPLTAKPLIAVENGPSGIDAKLEAELADLGADEAEAFRVGPPRSSRSSRASSRRSTWSCSSRRMRTTRAPGRCAAIAPPTTPRRPCTRTWLVASCGARSCAGKT